MQAYELFCDQDFVAAMDKYVESKCNPLRVIALYSNLLPESIDRKEILNSQRPPELSSVLLHDAYRALIPFLTHQRHTLISEEIRDIKSLTIIDTVLLKTYVYASPTMVSSLLRLENFCMRDECERVLRDENRIPELVLLLKSGNKHTEALKFLMNTEMTGKVERISEYLSDVPSFDVVHQFGSQVIRSHPEIAIQIFTSDGDAEKWPRDRIYEMFKNGKAPTEMIITLIEHYINKWNDIDPKTTTWLVGEYRNNIVELRNAMLDHYNDDHIKPSGDTLLAVDDLNVARKKLLDLLENSEYFNADVILRDFESGDWIEEKSILLSRLGRHEQALYVYAEGMPERALHYCKKIYKRCPDVYEYLLGNYTTDKYIS